MAKVNALIHSFNFGEVSKAALARVDQDKVRLCAEVQENLFPYTIGKAVMRPGMQYIGDTEVIATSPTNYPPRLIPFVKSIDTVALLEITYSSVGDPGTLRIWRNDEVVTYPAVTSSIASLTKVLTGGATATLAGSTFLATSYYKGGGATIKGHGTTSSIGIEHALKITVTGGGCGFCCGSTDGASDYISATTVGEGVHILSFTPAGANYYVTFLVTSPLNTLGDITVYNNGYVPIPLRLDAPWLGGNFRGIRYDQSLDVVFLVIPGGGPCQIERRSDRSWSIVRYKTVNGPFMTSRSDTQVRLKSNVTRGVGTLTADRAFFTADEHLGTLFQLTHGNFNASYGLSAEGEYTWAWKQTGIVYVNGSGVTVIDDRAFTITVAGTWVGSIYLQRSLVDEYSGFENYGSAITTNLTSLIPGNESDTNAIIWYRLNFSSYTSGAASVTVNYNGYGSSGICRVLAVTNPTSATIEIISDFTDTVYTEDWLEGEWSVSRGFPTAVALFDGRLWWSRRDRFWGSVSDAYYNYDTTISGDSAAIARAVATGGGYSDVKWLLPLQRLIFGTTGSEASARASSFDEPLTPTAITIKDASNHGVANINPLKIDSRGLFVHRSGRRLLELGYNVYTYDYNVTDLMRYNEDIGTSLQGIRVPGLVDDDIIELAVQRYPETWVWCLRDDGVIPVLFYNPSQEGLGWFKCLAGKSYAPPSMSCLANDKVGSIAVLPGEVEDSVYFIVQRRAYALLGEGYGDKYIYTLEKLARFQDSTYKVLSDAATNSISTYNGLYQLDSWKTGTVSASGVISGLDHLGGSFVMVIGPHYDSGGNIVSYGPLAYGPQLTPPAPLDAELIGYIYEVYPFGGTVTLDANFDRNLVGATVTVGLPYMGRYKSAKLAYGAQGGTALLQKKKVGPVGLLLTDYHPAGVQIGSDLDDPNAMDDLPALEGGAPVAYDSTLIDDLDGDMFPFPGIWDTDSRVCIKVKPGHSATLNALVAGIETNEK